jgi:hypothetical protein
MPDGLNNETPYRAQTICYLCISRRHCRIVVGGLCGTWRRRCERLRGTTQFLPTLFRFMNAKGALPKRISALASFEYDNRTRSAPDDNAA